MDVNVPDEGTSSMSSSMSAAEGQSETAQSALDLQNPWHYLALSFKLITINGNTFHFKCLLCLRGPCGAKEK